MRRSATPDQSTREQAANKLELAFDDRSAELRRRSPSACVEVYRLRIDER